MKNLLLIMIFTFSLIHSQNVSKNQVVINDVHGDVQVRSAHTPSWSPLTAGLTLSSNTFIRLNSPDSSVSIHYPVGGILKLFGFGSFFLDEISTPKNNVYHSKLLIFSGRWFYHDQKDFPSRFIVNSDITTSILEQGEGGGYFHKGTNEFILLKGRGLISYRQENIDAILLTERQYVNFNILDGFFMPKLITDDILRQYTIFEQTSPDSTQSTIEAK